MDLREKVLRKTFEVWGSSFATIAVVRGYAVEVNLKEKRNSFK